MKKNIRNILSVFILLISYIFLFKNIYAKDIEIHATPTSDGGAKALTFYTFAGAMESTVNAYRNNFNIVKVDDLSGLTFTSSNTETSESQEMSNGTIKTYSYLIHQSPLSDYEELNYTAPQTISGAENAKSCIGYVNNINATKTNYTKITNSKTLPAENYVEFNRISRGYQIVQMRATDQYIFVGQNLLTSANIDTILANVDNYKFTEDEGNYKFYITNPYAIKDTKGRILCRNDANLGTVGIRSAYNFLENAWYSSTTGYDLYVMNVDGKRHEYGDVYTINPNTAAHGLNSFLNDYDNILYIPKSVATSRKVYIRHVDEDGNLLVDKNNNPMYNDSAVLVSGDTESIINTSSYASNNDHPEKFPEYYEIGTTNQLKVSRLLTLVKDGTIYEFNNVKKSTATKYEDAFNSNENALPSYSEETVTVDTSNRSDVTVITFQYKKIPGGGENDGEPKGGIKTIENYSDLEGCHMSYTPTGAPIRPYLIANKIKLDTLKYIWVKNGNKVKYKLNDFKVNKLVSGSIDNNTTQPSSLGQIFGGRDDKWTLLEGTPPKDFSINYNWDEINDSLTEFIENYADKMPSQVFLSDFVKRSVNKTKYDQEVFPNTFTVPENRYNGLRIPKLSANYKLYDVINKKNTSEEIVLSDPTSTIAKVLVYNPITVKAPTVKSTSGVDHSSSTNTETSVIQMNADFELEIEPDSNGTYANITGSTYLDRYFLIFDIDIINKPETEYEQLYSVSGERLVPITIEKGESIQSGTLIEIIKPNENNYKIVFKAKTGNDNRESSTVDDAIAKSEVNITLIGVSKNMPGETLREIVLTTESDNIEKKQNVQTFILSGQSNNSQFYTDTGKDNIKVNYCDVQNDQIGEYRVHKDDRVYGGKNMYGDAYYFAKAVQKATKIGRIYDFKVTDCSDIDYKSVFRETTGVDINKLKGIRYFSGIKELKIYTNEVSTLEERDDISIQGSGAKKIIPLGPYKSTITSYVSAPKLGYRISFDLKTSGLYNPTQEAQTHTKEINIKPSYYYISKDGTEFKENITLYYKNSSGKHVKFDDSNYTIYFKPNDGYRILNNSSGFNTENMSTQLEPLVIGSKDGFTLNSKMMSLADNNFIQEWYGEFKLPNSTIATTGRISDQLTDGYIGVKFEIESIDNKGKNNEKKISYNTENKNANPKNNTTQWDYEGFLGFRNPGSDAENLTLQLEKGTWNINNDIYNKIKGTVVLFDTDNRAANDFE